MLNFIKKWFTQPQNQIITFEDTLEKINQHVERLGIDINEWNYIEGFISLPLYKSLDMVNEIFHSKERRSVPMVALMHKKSGEVRLYAIKAFMDIDTDKQP